MENVRSSLLISLAEKYSVVFINTISVIIIARLLTPTEIGIYSVGLAFVNIAHTLRDFGVGNYLIQEKELTEERIRTAAGITLLLAWSLALGLALGSGVIADFYNNPEMRSVLLILSLSFVVIPFSSPTLAMLRRDMAFSSLYQIRTISAIVHASVAVGLAWNGFGFKSLAWASFAGVLTTAVLAATKRPSLGIIIPSFVEWRRVGSFGGKASVDALITQIGMGAVDMIAGRMLGFAAVGVYSRAQGLISMFSLQFMSAVIQVAFPAFASSHRAGKDLKEPFLKAVGTLTVFAWPFYAYLILTAYPVIRIMFGDQWDAAVPLVQILSVSGMIGATWNLTGQVLLGMGKINEMLRAQIVIQVTNVALVAAAATVSITYIAYSKILLGVVIFLAMYYFIRPILKLRYRDLVLAVRKSVLVTLTSSLAPAYAAFLMDVGPDNLWGPFLVSSAGMAIGWLLGIYLFRHSFGVEISGAFQSVLGKLGKA